MGHETMLNINFKLTCLLMLTRGKIYWPAKEKLQNIDAIRFIVKTKNSNCRT